ncbi:hypothetical protein FGRMN_1151 [Fusarium graminum]|nr:hypothetical protein FGRMN_1151 [Fusarium graminum]
MASGNFIDTPSSAGNRGQLINKVSQWQCCNCDFGWVGMAANAHCPQCQVMRCNPQQVRNLDLPPSTKSDESSVDLRKR